MFRSESILRARRGAVLIRAAVALLVLSATVAIAGTPPVVPDPCTSCVFTPPTVIVTTPGATLTLTGDTVAGSYLTALSCGDLGCAYNGAFFDGIEAPFSVAGDCGQYSGLAGDATRASTGTPGKCVVKYDPSPYVLIAPGGYDQIDYFQSVGGAVTGGKTFLIGVPVEIFILTVTPTDPVGNEVPGSVFAVKPAADPAAADCVTDVATGYLPDRVAPDCVILGKSDPPVTFSRPLPDGKWDVLAFTSATPIGKLRSVVTPWKSKRITMAGANKQIQITRAQYPQLSITGQLVGGDDKLSVDEDGIVRVTVAASSSGVEGFVKSINFINQKPIFQQGPGGGGSVSVSTATPPPPYGFTLAPGESRVFDVPVRGVAAGPVNLVAKTFGFTPLNEDRNAEQTFAIQVTSDVPPPPERPTEVCGYDVLTYLASASAGSALAVESAASIAAGTELVVDPCTGRAEQVTVSTVAGTILTLTKSLKSPHAKGAPVIRRFANGTILANPSPVGAKELDVLRADRFMIGDTIVVEPGTDREEGATVTGFGSLVVDPPMQFAHPIGAEIVRSAPVVTVQGDRKQTVAVKRVRFRGTASDDVAVQRVEVKVGDGTYEQATLTPTAVAGVVDWSLRVKLQPGLNVVKIRAFDDDGNVSATVKLKVTRQ